MVCVDSAEHSNTRYICKCIYTQYTEWLNGWPMTANYELCASEKCIISELNFASTPHTHTTWVESWDFELIWWLVKRHTPPRCSPLPCSLTFFFFSSIILFLYHQSKSFFMVLLQHYRTVQHSTAQLVAAVCRCWLHRVHIIYVWAVASDNHIYYYNFCFQIN